MEDNGFTLVKKKNSSKRRMGKCNIEKRTTEIFGDKNIKIEKDEVKRRVDTAIVDLSSSDYLSEVLRYVKEVSRVKWDNIYCFGLCGDLDNNYLLTVVEDSLEDANSDKDGINFTLSLVSTITQGHNYFVFCKA